VSELAQRAEEQALGLPVGAPAPDFELPDLSGSPRALSELTGRRVALVFFDPECSFCRSMVPRLLPVLRSLAAGPLTPLVLSTGGVESNRAIFGDADLARFVLIQDEMEVATMFRATATPSMHLIGDGGNIAGKLALGAEEVLDVLSNWQAERSETDTTGNRVESSTGITHRLRSVQESTLQRSGLPVGASAPNFSLPRIGGGEASLSDFVGTPLLLVFSDVDCAPCNALAPELERLYRSRPGARLLMIARGTRAANEAKVHEYGLTFPVVLQRRWEISREYGMFATPIAFSIDEYGIIDRDVAVGVKPVLELAASVWPGVPAGKGVLARSGSSN
jgi:peroxiredoxin